METEFSIRIFLTMVTGGLAMCALLLTLLTIPRDRDVTGICARLTLVTLAVPAALLGYTTAAFVLLGIVTLDRFRAWLLRRYGNYTLACLVFRQHEWCNDHLRCGCPHHDAHIMEEMSRSS